MARHNGAMALTISEESESSRKKRALKIWVTPGTGPKHRRPGAEYAPGQIAQVHCEMCRREMTIVPRTHPHSMRRRDGTVAWLCSPCSGVRYKDSVSGTHFIER